MSKPDNRAVYRYAAEDQREMESLRRRYAAEAPEDRLTEMRSLDRQVTRRATVTAVGIGVGGTLLLGAGLSMVLSMNLMVPGIVVGCCGIAIMSAMPAVYERLLRRERRRAASGLSRQEGSQRHE